MNKLIAAAACLTVSLVGFAGAAHAEATTYAVDPTHTFASFEIGHMGTSTIRGRFDKKEGSVQLDRAAKTGKVDISIDLTSVSTGVAPLDKHLQSKDFFNTAENPSAKFTSTRLVFAGDKLSEVVGTLTMNGKTQPLTLKTVRFNCYDSPMLKREVCGGDFEATVKRSLWGVNFGLTMGAPDDVRLLVQVEGVKQ